MTLSPLTSWALLIGLVPIALVLTFAMLRLTDWIADTYDRIAEWQRSRPTYVHRSERDGRWL